MDTRKRMFEIFTEYKIQYDLYEKTIEFINQTIEDTKGEENAVFYEILRQLSNSINNTGCEERRSNQIDIINKSMYVISGKYEKYLP